MGGGAIDCDDVKDIDAADTNHDFILTERILVMRFKSFKLFKLFKNKKKNNNSNNLPSVYLQSAQKYVLYIPADMIRDMRNAPARTHMYIMAAIAAACDQLAVPCPDVTWAADIVNPDGDTYSGLTIFENEEKELQNNLLILPWINAENPYEMVLAAAYHEVRHIWQHTHAAHDYDLGQHSFLDSLFNNAEIDADAYAMYRIVQTTGCDYDTAGHWVCPDERAFFRDAYDARIRRAMTIADGLQG